MRLHSLVLLAPLLLAEVSVAQMAHASGVDPSSATAVQREQAQTRYMRGRKKFDSNDFAGSLAEFTASLDIVASPNARLYVARSLEKLGRLVEAYAEFGRTATEAKEHEHEDSRYAKTNEAAITERDLIGAKLAFVQIKVLRASSSTKLRIAGDEIQRAGWDEPTPVMPGVVVVQTESSGVSPTKTEVKVEAGKHVQIAIDAAADGEAKPVIREPVVKSDEPIKTASAPGWVLPAAITAGGVGVVGALLFAIEGSASSSTYSDLKNTCGTGPCPAAKQSEVSTGKSQQTIANVGLVVGAVGIAAAAAFSIYYFTSKGSSGKKDAPSAAVYLNGLGGGLRGSF